MVAGDMALPSGLKSGSLPPGASTPDIRYRRCTVLGRGTDEPARPANTDDNACLRVPMRVAPVTALKLKDYYCCVTF